MGHLAAMATAIKTHHRTLAVALAAAAASALLTSYPWTYGQCLRWAADKPTPQGVYVASRVCIGMVRRAHAAQQ